MQALNWLLRAICAFRGEYAKFGFPDTPKGILPTSIGVTTLMEEVGVAKTKELLWGGRLIGAKEAQGLGIVNDVIPDSYLLEEGIAMSHSLACLPAEVLEVGKRLRQRRGLLRLKRCKNSRKGGWNHGI